MSGAENVSGFGLPFDEALRFFRRKVDLPTRRWDDLLRGAQARGFTVAGVTRDDMLADFRSAMDRAMVDLDYAVFRDRFDEIVDRTGWQFNARGTTDEQRRDWRARIIFDTNLRTAYAAGRYRQMTDPDVAAFLPFWRYNHNDSANPREQHQAWDGLILEQSDPWWQVHYPPNGFGCKCDVTPLSRRDLKRLGRDGPDRAPPDQSYETTDPRTGQTELVFPGVGRGWDYNVGREWTAGLVPPQADGPLPAGESPKRTDLPPMPPARRADPALILPDRLSEDATVDAFLSVFGATRERPVEFRDRSGGIILISSDMFDQRAKDGAVVGRKATKRQRNPYVLLLADAVADPDEIWVNWQKLKSGSLRLMRTYLRRATLPDGRELFLNFSWEKDGWVAKTAFDTDARYLEGQRRGVMLYRRDDALPIRPE
jgi:phage-Barnase-EndoU-ColicinE5/D-RelE like nuclease2/Phage Mu protein F like protein